jgi:hypothetical protein
MKKVLFLGGIMAACMAATPVLAHHSAAQFDFSQSIKVDGIVKEYEVNNPHSKLVMEVSDDKGSRAIPYEGHSRNNIYRRGWRPDSVKVGDHVTITIAPLRSGDEGGYVQSMTTDDGQSF